MCWIPANTLESKWHNLLVIDELHHLSRNVGAQKHKPRHPIVLHPFRCIILCHINLTPRNIHSCRSNILHATPLGINPGDARSGNNSKMVMEVLHNCTGEFDCQSLRKVVLNVAAAESILLYAFLAIWLGADGKSWVACPCPSLLPYTMPQMRESASRQRGLHH